MAMRKISSPIFNQQVQQVLKGIRRPNSQVGGVLQSALQQPAGNGFMENAGKPVMATFKDPRTLSNFAVPPNFTALDMATKLRAVRNRFRQPQLPKTAAIPFSKLKPAPNTMVQPGNLQKVNRCT
jgi:hypothetical protein